MDNKMLSIGKDNTIPRKRVIAFLYPDSHPVKKLISDKRDVNQLIDATRGKKTRSVILMDNGYIILSSVRTTTLRTHYEDD